MGDNQYHCILKLNFSDQNGGKEKCLENTLKEGYYLCFDPNEIFLTFFRLKKTTNHSWPSRWLNNIYLHLYHNFFDCNKQFLKNFLIWTINKNLQNSFLYRTPIIEVILLYTIFLVYFDINLLVYYMPEISDLMKSCNSKNSKSSLYTPN